MFVFGDLENRIRFLMLNLNPSLPPRNKKNLQNSPEIDSRFRDLNNERVMLIVNSQIYTLIVLEKYLPVLL